MSEDRSRSPFSPEHRHTDHPRDLHVRDRSPRHQREDSSPRQQREDSYSASLRLASLETLTGKAGDQSRHHHWKREAQENPQNWAPADQPDHRISWRENQEAPRSSSPSKVPISLPSLLASMAGGGGGAPADLSQLLAAGQLSQLPKPADLIQQAQALQLLAHLQTVLINTNQHHHHNNGNHNNGSHNNINQQQINNISQIMHSQAEMQKVYISFFA